MTSIRIVLTIVISIALTSFGFENKQEIEIRLIYKNHNDIGFDQITIKNRKEIVSRVDSDIDGILKIPTDLLIDSVNYDLFLTSIGVNGTYLTTINSKTTGIIEITLPKAYDMRMGKAICPKCKNINKVYKAVYNNPPIVTIKVVNGDTIYSPISNGKYYMDTDVTNELDPRWYCERDDLKY
tara:strand:+ start:812 stop:1357 length:546 start_codon:yes stop_codon:yes gene_type:complete